MFFYQSSKNWSEIENHFRIYPIKSLRRMYGNVFPIESIISLFEIYSEFDLRLDVKTRRI